MAAETDRSTRTVREGNSAQPLVRLNVNLNAETASALREIADDLGISFTEAVRRAISVYKYIDDEKRKGRKIQTSNPDRTDVHELVLI